MIFAGARHACFPALAIFSNTFAANSRKKIVILRAESHSQQRLQGLYPRTVSRLSVTTTTNTPPPDQHRHLVTSERPGSERSASKIVCTQSSANNTIFPTRLTGLDRLSAHAGLDQGLKRPLPTAAFALPPDSCFAYTRASVRSLLLPDSVAF